MVGTKVFLLELLPLLLPLTGLVVSLLEGDGQQVVPVWALTGLALVLHNIEILVYKPGVALDVVQRLPHNVGLVEEALVGDEEVEHRLLLPDSGEVIVAEEHGKLAVLQHGVKLADTVVGQLTGGLL